ncbi:MAG TPA: tetratricopeptide repeat protein, partial [Candidatus Ozemobacteraceae bacterium]|nr:tetratricopeptide repeat protein [Candidatus Ozemobacteraceae bacterium]
LLNTIESRSVRYRRVDYLEFASDCLLALRRDKEAADLLRDAPETRQHPPLLAKLARLLLSRNDLEAARAAYEQLVTMNPDSREYRRALGHCLSQMKRPDEALTVWRGIFGQMGISQLEAYQFLLDTLIEHRLYEESLDVFQEARAALGNAGLFAEEKAGVLMTLNRESEAIDEFLLALPAGGFKIDIFEKLYGYHGKKVDLEQKLRDLMSSGEAFYVARRALIELYFREARPEQVAKVVALAQGGLSDDMLFERIQQALSTQADGFVRQIIVSLIQQFHQSSLAWRLAPGLLELPDQTPTELQEAREIATTLAARPNPPDFLLRRRLLIALAIFHLDTLSDPQEAVRWLSQAESMPSGGSRREAFQMHVLACRLHTLQGRFSDTDNDLARLRGLIGDPTAPAATPPATDPFGDSGAEGGLDLGESDYSNLVGGELTADDRAQFIYLEAWVLCHKGEYQPALTKLRSIIDEFPSSTWVNDALALALEITMGSIGTMEALGKLFGAERAVAVGSFPAALDLYEQVRVLASGTSLSQEAEARHILLSERTASPAALIARIDAFRKANPAQLTGADLLLLKHRLQRRMNSSADERQQTLREFLDRYPGDLRGRRVTRLLQSPAEASR